MMIYEALSSLSVPVCHPPYKGAEETYITYQLLGQSGQIYAEGGDAESGVLFVVSMFADGFAAELLKRVKDALETAGYITTIDMETYDKETGRTQIALIAETEGAEYG